MVADADLFDDTSVEEREPGRGRHVLMLVLLVVWGAATVWVVGSAALNPSVSQVVVAAAFVGLCVILNLQLLLLRWAGRRNWSALVTRLSGAAYFNDEYKLPNRNYLLSELRREMPRSRKSGKTFVLVQLSIDDFAGIRERRGEEFAVRTTKALTALMKRISRQTDFVAYMDTSRLCVLLIDCRLDQSYLFLERVPSVIAVSDGREMLDVPVTARLHEYDLQSLYATDVLREVEIATPLLRGDEAGEREWSQVA
ncbi:MAG TPA: diguanylate cyclase [Tepidiformaceae bacterium]